MRRTDIDGEGDTDANQGISLSGSGRRLDAVIPFPRRAKSAACPAAEDTPPVSSAPFEPLGPLVQAVVMRLKDDRVRLKVMAAGPREEETDRQP